MPRPPMTFPIKNYDPRFVGDTTVGTVSIPGQPTPVGPPEALDALGVLDRLNKVSTVIYGQSYMDLKNDQQMQVFEFAFPTRTVGGLPMPVGTPGRGVPVQGAGFPDYEPNLKESDFPTASDERRILDPIINARLRETGGGLATLSSNEDPSGLRLPLVASAPTGLPTTPGQLPVDTGFVGNQYPDVAGRVAAAREAGATTSTEAGFQEKGMGDRIKELLGSDAGRAIAYGLAALGDSMKENLTLAGHRGARGRGLETLLAFERARREDERLGLSQQTEARRATTDQARVDIERQRVAREEQTARSAATSQLIKQGSDLLVTIKTAPESVGADAIKALYDRADAEGAPGTRAVLQAMFSRRDLGEQIGDYLKYVPAAQAPALMATFEALIQRGDMDQAFTKLQNVAALGVYPSLFQAMRTVAEKAKASPGYTPGTPIPMYALEAQLDAPQLAALRSTPNTPFEKGRETVNDHLAILGFEQPRVAEAVAKQTALMPGQVEAARQTAEATEPSRERVAAATGVEAARIGIQKAKEMPVGAGAVNWENDQGKRPPADKGIDWLVSNGFRPTGKLSTEDSRRAIDTLLGQIDALVPVLKQKGFLSTQYNFAAVGMAGFNRKLYPGDPDLQKFLVHAGTMVAVGRNLGDIGSRAIQAYESLIDVIRHPTSADATTGAIQQLREALHVQAGIAPKKTPSGYTIERIR